MSHIWKVVHEPEGTAYERLIRILLDAEDTFSLVWRGGSDYGEEARELASAVEPYKVSEARRDRWPGTRLFGGKARIATYRCTPAAAASLGRPGRLFGWTAPRFPEDLWFASASGGLSLVTVAHEQLAWLLSGKLASQLGQVVTLERERRTPGDEEAFERAV